MMAWAAAPAAAAQKYRYARAPNGAWIAIPIRAVYDETGFRRYVDGWGGTIYEKPKPTYFDSVAAGLRSPLAPSAAGAPAAARPAFASGSPRYQPLPAPPPPQALEIINPYFKPSKPPQPAADQAE
jgi:hypothetical protein